MPTDLQLILEDRPGQLAAVAEALGNAEINIEGGCGVLADGQFVIHVLVDDVAAALEALERAGLMVNAENEAIVLTVEDKPGELGRIARKAADADLNLNFCYLATSTRLVVGADNLEKLAAALR